MNGDPIDWLTRHYTEGVHLRERGAAFREDNTVEVSAWEKDVATWINELKEGIHLWSPGHMVRLNPLNRIRVEPVNRPSLSPPRGLQPDFLWSPCRQRVLEHRRNDAAQTGVSCPLSATNWYIKRLNLVVGYEACASLWRRDLFEMNSPSI